MAWWSQLHFQTASTNLMENISTFHDYAMGMMASIMLMVGTSMMFLMTNSFTSRNLLEAPLVETLWTTAPMFILVALALPSLFILYCMEEQNNPLLTIKIIGNQWYWSYEYMDLKNLTFTSYMLDPSTMKSGEPRLLEVDNPMVIPFNTEIRLIITSADVIHSWTIPTLGIKVDAIPGRLNQASVNLRTPGIFYGQCSEICGANHSFMPITMEVVSWEDFTSWTKNFK